MKHLRIPQTVKFRSKRERLFVLTALGTVVIFLIVRFVIDPFVESQRSIREEIPVKALQLEKSRRLLGEKTEAQLNLRKMQELFRSCQLKMLPGDTAPLAAANLQETLKTLAALHQISIKSEKVLDTRSSDFLDQISVQIEFTTQISNLTNFLYDLQTHAKVLIVSDCSIAVNTYRGPRDVRAVIVVAGLMPRGTSNQ